MSDEAKRAEVAPAALRGIPLLAELDDEVLREVADRFETERFAAAQTVFEKGDRGDKFYFIAEGAVSVTTRDADGNERELAVLGEGNHFGEIALLREVPRTATIRTRFPTVLLSLPRERFLGLMDRLPELRRAMDRAAAERLGEPGRK